MEQNLKRIFKEIIELNEELSNAMDGIINNLSNKPIAKSHFFTFNQITFELKHKFWIVQKACEADYFDD